jgi:hypothetical protein
VAGFLRRSSLRRRTSEQGRCGLGVRLVGLEGILVGVFGFAVGVIKRVWFGVVLSSVGVMSDEHL